MRDFIDKGKVTIYVLDGTVKKVEELYKENGCESKSEFIEKAINFYSGYINADKNQNYLSEILITTVGEKLQRLEDRMANMMFKIAVEMGIMQHIVAYNFNIDDEQLFKLRGLCSREVKRINGNITFEEARKIQKG